MGVCYCIENVKIKRLVANRTFAVESSVCVAAGDEEPESTVHQSLQKKNAVHPVTDNI